MNGYAEAPGQTSLLKMSKIVVEKILPDPTLPPHSLVAPAHLPHYRLCVAVVEAVRLLNNKDMTS